MHTVPVGVVLVQIMRQQTIASALDKLIRIFNQLSQYVLQLEVHKVLFIPYHPSANNKDMLTGLEVNIQFCCPEEWEYSTRRNRVNLRFITEYLNGC